MYYCSVVVYFRKVLRLLKFFRKYFTHEVFIQTVNIKVVKYILHKRHIRTPDGTGQCGTSKNDGDRNAEDLLTCTSVLRTCNSYIEIENIIIFYHGSNKAIKQESNT